MKKQGYLRKCGCECGAFTAFTDSYGISRLYCAAHGRDITVGIDIIQDFPIVMTTPKEFPDWCPLEEVPNA